MSKLHYFNPDNDIALAADVANFTPPRAALNLRNAGAMLPLWYADAGDRVLVHGVNAAWLDSVRERFAIDVDVFDHDTANLQPTPWGWSKASRQTFVKEGFTQESLPVDTQLTAWRQLSHRRTVAEVCRRLAPRLDFEIAPPAREYFDKESLRAYLLDNPDSIIKSPWSSSGRGLLYTRQMDAGEVLRRCEGIIARQGSVMVEPAYRRVADFAMLFTAEHSKVVFNGYSLFDTDASGAYSGNLLADQIYIIERLSQFYPIDRLSEVSDALCSVLTELVAPEYSGPMGIDVLVAQRCDGSLLLDATVELNLRMTMGFVALNLSRRYLAPGIVGRYYVAPDNKNMADDSVEIVDHKIVGGRIILTPPGGQFSFVVEANKL